MVDNEFLIPANPDAVKPKEIIAAGILAKPREGAEIVFDEAEKVENTVCILCNTHLDSPSKERVVKDNKSYWAHPEGQCEGDKPSTTYAPLPER